MRGWKCEKNTLFSNFLDFVVSLEPKIDQKINKNVIKIICQKISWFYEILSDSNSGVEIVSQLPDILASLVLLPIYFVYSSVWTFTRFIGQCPAWLPHPWTLIYNASEINYLAHPNLEYYHCSWMLPIMIYQALQHFHINQIIIKSIINFVDKHKYHRLVLWQYYILLTAATCTVQWIQYTALMRQTEEDPRAAVNNLSTSLILHQQHII